jgi:hypothetical protein
VKKHWEQLVVAVHCILAISDEADTDLEQAHLPRIKRPEGKSAMPRSETTSRVKLTKTRAPKRGEFGAFQCQFVGCSRH